MRRVPVLWMTAVLTLLSGSAFADDKPTPAATEHPKTLEELAREFQAAQKADDAERLIALGLSVVPTTDELRAIVQDTPAGKAFLDRYKGPKDLTAGSEQHRALARSVGGGLFRPFNRFRPVNSKGTVIKVHAATTEEIVAYAGGTAAFAEFPGGMRRFAALAQPARTWYVVECLEPGRKHGMKYTCFTRVNGRFLLIFKPWRSIPREDSK